MLHSINNDQLGPIRNLLREYENLRESGPPKSESVASLSRKFVDLTGKYTKEALSVNLVKNSLRQFQSYQRKFKTLEGEIVDKGHAAVNAAMDKASVGRVSPDQDQVQVQITYEPINAEELEQQTLMVEEREREIQQISQDTREINEIFSNLQDIIQEQQFQVDTIEDNILSYSTDAQGASRELRRAERYQKRSGGRMLCCLLILIGVFGSVILIGLIF
ncbi:hypothetical protein JCM33374_g66 [Metschnikowia sp. JCM 33374]|nr:hypothetical protein JCM33374_g66 [Metschnikowia sp. JCM 33374]